MNVTVEELIDNFELLGNWDDRYMFIISLGKELPVMADEHKVEDNRVHGCQSTVWLIIEPTDDTPVRMNIVADSEAFIVKGLISILLTVYSGKTAREILDTDENAIFKQLGLDQHLSAGRRNGLHSMVNRIKALAKSLTS